VNNMQMQPWLALVLAHEHQRREAARAAAERQSGGAHSSVRRQIGRRVIALGERIAADPSFELARSR
jgi:hypothetical protein